MAEFKRNTSSKFKGRGSKFGGRNFDRNDSRESGRFNKRSPNKFGGRSFDKPEKTTVICDSCKKKCEVPFKPTSNKPIYCDDCFKKNSNSRSGNSNEFTEINIKLDKIMKALKIKQDLE